ncbi:hypothetical protein P4S93_14000 [Aneurinibacillus thermoaerophilus]|uniref:CRISPR-associated protein Cst1 n=1 Tax=Aneurinibacillus thermoaerophilus TaxID=143495 RepID=A0A1G8CGW6_ANETH|nr:hypothetical protein [Aneurinibacillus thermoaerophilus]MED0674134.1 hypothetical protein [Aneurinibacillus thermoaerophilus]MED0758604.1 hypothetical protein [Aneurinibacillus thermoaerophilus]MED0761873.1 hypothetical protein [Aneurinibacillus thermoaerophilus]SDH44675.1 hypothetical protein SAMN04489735_102546 [Aneurinibacillus thermoaerophilus]
MSVPQVYVFRLRHQWWIDCGIVGLYQVARSLQSKYPDIDISLSSDNQELRFTYSSQDQLREFLRACYEELATRHWNVSTKKQHELREWVVYNRELDRFDCKPKRQPTPIPALFVKGSSWRAEAIPISQLHQDNPTLAQRAEQYIQTEKKTFWGSKKQLLFEPPVCHADLVILPEEKKKKSVCSVCGKASSACEDVSQPAFLLFASNSAAKSFNSELNKPDKLCWECSFLSRFAVETALYRKTNDKLFILQLYAPSVRKMSHLQEKMGVLSAVRELDKEYFLSNIEMKKDGLLYRARKPYEFLWAYYNKVYQLYKEERDKQAADPFILELMKIALDEAPLQMALFVVSPKGQTFMIDELVFYDETAYIFRLLHELSMVEPQVDLKSFYHDLHDPTDDTNPTMYRNRILRRVLEKKLIIEEVERFAFHVSREGHHPNLRHILQFTIFYESLIRKEVGLDIDKEDTMNPEQIKMATQLGKQIVYSARDYLCGSDAKRNDELKKIKGDLFSLRKTRTKADFMSQVNTLQMRYGIIVPKEYVNGVLEQCHFEHFKAYVVTSALNAYNTLMYYKSKEGEKTDE